MIIMFVSFICFGVFRVVIRGILIDADVVVDDAGYGVVLRLCCR